MVQPKYDPQESLERIKLMMKYDTSKTLNENKENITEMYHWLLPSGEIILGSTIKGAIPAGAKAFQTMAAAEEAAAALGAGEAAAAGGLTWAGAGSAALAAAPWLIGGAAAAGLLYWMYDSINNGMPTAAKVKAFLDACSSKDKNLKQIKSDSEIVSAAEKINASIEGLGTDEDAIKSAISSMGNVADLCALKEKYDARYGSLYEDLDGDIDGTDWKTYVWAPMQTIIEKSAKQIEPIVDECKTNPNKPGCKGGGGGGGGTKYKSCSGTYTINCKADAISTVQACIGLNPDGKFGPKTAAKLKELGYTSFKDADVTVICGKGKVEVKPEPEVSGEDLAINTTDTNF
jgi:hypothetical protein